jgi:hypothetical protein
LGKTLRFLLFLRHSFARGVMNPYLGLTAPFPSMPQRPYAQLQEQLAPQGASPSAGLQGVSFSSPNLPSNAFTNINPVLRGTLTDNPTPAGGSKPSEKAEPPLGASRGGAWLMPRTSTLAGLFVGGALLSASASLLLKRPQALAQNVVTGLKAAQRALKPTLKQAESSAVRSLAEVAAQRSSETLRSGLKQGLSHSEVEISIYENDPWLALSRTMQLYPSLTPQVLQYSGIAVLGYVGSTLLQGLQEAWVRFEESCIRADLVSRLKESFQSSIELKSLQDDTHLAYAQQRLSAMLAKHHIPKPEGLLEGLQGAGSVGNAAFLEQRQFVYMPQNRLPQLAAASPCLNSAEEKQGVRFLEKKQNAGPTGHNPALNNNNNSVMSEPKPASAGYFSPTHWVKPTIKGGVFALGGMTGWLATFCWEQGKKAFAQTQLENKVSALLKQNKTAEAERLLTQNHALNSASSALKSLTPKVVEYVNPNNLEGLSLMLLEQWGHMKNPSALKSLVGIFTISSLLGVGKLALSGLREIEVTKMNAETELSYEKYKWLQLDTMYHRVAERTLLDHALQRFEANLETLKDKPEQLKAAISGLLSTVGLWSPPPYYPVTPSVQLVVSRS